MIFYIRIISAYKSDNHPLSKLTQSLMYVVAIQQCNENLKKLSNSETKQITLIYKYGDLSN